MSIQMLAQPQNPSSSTAKVESDFSLDFFLQSLRFCDEDKENAVHPFQHRIELLSFKSYKARVNQEKRRSEFIEKQKAARRYFTECARHDKLQQVLFVLLSRSFKYCFEC
jgi:hypothetical protein